jgi:hypothetical protein
LGSDFCTINGVMSAPMAVWAYSYNLVGMIGALVRQFCNVVAFKVRVTFVVPERRVRSAELARTVRALQSKLFHRILARALNNQPRRG